MFRICGLAALCFLFLLNTVQAGVVLGGTRIIYPSNQAEVQIALKNRDANERYLVQSWVSDINDNKAPFIITPPIYKLEENQQTLLHVVYSGNKNMLPEDRESLFMANVKSISAIPANMRDQNALQFAVKTRIKLFYRPSSLNNNEAKNAWEKLRFHQSQGQLVVDNPTPYFVTFGKLTVGGKNVVPAVKTKLPSALTMMLPPFAEQRFQLPGNGAVTWTAIDDFGSETRSITQSP